MGTRTVQKNYIEHAGRRFHERADPDAYELAIDLFRALPAGRVLDLAAGAGLTSVRLAELGHRVKAYEIHTEQFVPTEIEVAKADLNAALPELDASVDGVMALEVIEHLENPRRFLRDVGRVVRSGGMLVLSTPNVVNFPSKLRFLFREELELFFDVENRVRDPFCEEASGHISPLLPWLLRIFLREAGFRVEETRYTRRYGVRSKHFGRCLILRAVRE